MTIKAILVRLQNGTKKKHKLFVQEQTEFAACVNDCVERLHNGEKLSSKNVNFNLKSAIKNEAIRHARKAISDFKKGKAKTLPIFRNSLGVKINNQNWNSIEKNGNLYTISS